MDADKFMIRGVGQARYDLAVGEPHFLREHLHLPIWAAPEPVQAEYPAYRGSHDLLDELEKLFPGKRVVVTNGAKQALLAAFYAYSQMGIETICHKAPYWPSYPTLVALAGMYFGDQSDFKATKLKFAAGGHRAVVGTFINNPDGSVQTEPVDILDCAYAHPVYGWDGNMRLPEHQVSVWSAAKLFAMCGERVGWLVTENEEVAEKAASYVEKTTSGVNTRAQNLVARALRHTDDCLNPGYVSARATLLENKKFFDDAMGPYIEPQTGDFRGMFAWFQALDPRAFSLALKQSGVSVVPGWACGVHDVGRYRMSMGHTNEVTRKALVELLIALERPIG